jgi:hypothetical protein
MNKTTMLNTCEQYFNNLWATKWLNLMKSKDVKYREMCANPNFQLSFVKDDEIYYADRLSKNPNLTLEFVLAHRLSYWDWDEISKHPNVTMEMIDAHPELPWKLGYVIFNPNFTREYHDKITNQFKNEPLAQLSHSSKYAIKRDDVVLLDTYIKYGIGCNQFTEENLEIFFEHANKTNVAIPPYFFQNDGIRNISVKFVEKHIDQPWSWWQMHCCHDFTPNFAFKHLNQEWNWNGIVIHPKFTHQYLTHQLITQKQYYVEFFVKYNPNATYDIVNQINPNLIERWKKSNTHITMHDIANNPSISWNYYTIMSANKNMTLHFVTNNANKLWNWKTLATNPLDRIEWVNRQLMRIVIAILLEYHEMFYSPLYVERVFCNDYLVMNVMRFL